MLRDLHAGTGSPRRVAEVDPNDSVFLVLLWFDQGERKHYEVTSLFLGLGEAQAAAERYGREGSRTLGHTFDYATVLEIQTGQLAPKMERHGNPYPRVSEEPPNPQDEKAALLLEINKLRAQLGQSQTTQIR